MFDILFAWGAQFTARWERERERERGREGGREERTQRREEGRGWSVEEEVNWRQNGKVSKFLQLSPDTFDSFNSFDQWKMIQLKRISGQIGTGPVPPTKEARWPRSLFTFKVSKELLLLVVSLVGLLLSRHTNTTTHPASWGLEQVAFRSHTMINDVAYTLLFRKKNTCRALLIAPIEKKKRDKIHQLEWWNHLRRFGAIFLAFTPLPQHLKRSNLTWIRVTSVRRSRSSSGSNRSIGSKVPPTNKRLWIHPHWAIESIDNFNLSSRSSRSSRSSSKNKWRAGRIKVERTGQQRVELGARLVSIGFYWRWRWILSLFECKQETKISGKQKLN